MLPEIRVVLLKAKDGQERAQIRVGSKAETAVPLADFHETVRALLQGHEPGAWIACEDCQYPTPASVRSTSGAILMTGQPPAAAQQPQQQPGVQPQGPASPFDSRNPYNFAEWPSTDPWRAESSNEASHHRWSDGCLSGVITLRLTAKTPVFVPAGPLPEDAQINPQVVQPFWSCGARPNGQPRYGLPGSTVKGASRVLYEIWTNSRLGSVSAADTTSPIPYRRRCATAWVVHQVDPDGSCVVRRCEIKFVKQTGAIWRYRDGNQMQPWNQNQNPTPVVRVSSTNTTSWQAIPFRANLFWVPPNRHHHRYSHLAVRVTTTPATISGELVCRYLDGLAHSMFEQHPKFVGYLNPPAAGGGPPGGGPRDYYTAVATESIARNRPDLANLDVGAVIFALEGAPGRIACFGKNVNFLWRSRRSPKDLIGNLWPREELLLENADWAEGAFGFAANHVQQGTQTVSHPFRGRVRFEAFWAAEGATPMAPTPLKPLLSPSGVKLKARPLYLAPGNSGRSASWDDGDPSLPPVASNPLPRLRGRKLYWHQGIVSGQIHATHRSPGDVTEYPVMQPMPTGTVFAGRVHFDNLTPAELGALLVSLCPGLFWDNANAYGWKVGKGKPRGLGSMAPVIEALELRRTAPEAYSNLGESVMRNALVEIDTLVAAFRSRLNAKYPAAGFVLDLQELLRFPAADPSPRDYLPPGGDYGWMPAFGNEAGEANNLRPRAMRRARDIPVP